MQARSPLRRSEVRPIPGLASNDLSSPDDLPTGLTLMWPGKSALDDIMHAAADTQREMAASDETPATIVYQPGTGSRCHLQRSPAAWSRRWCQGRSWRNGWLPQNPEELNGFSLAGAAAAARRLASWAQTRELAAVAEIAARAAVRDDSVPVGPNGGPARVPDDAADEVALALCMSRFGASWWNQTRPSRSHGGCLTRWTPSAPEQSTFPAAKLIAEATSLLDDDAAAGGRRPGSAFGRPADAGPATRRAAPGRDQRGSSGAERRRQEAERMGPSWSVRRRGGHGDSVWPEPSWCPVRCGHGAGSARWPKQ